jgi:Ca2+/Na+ antiporter
MKMSKLKSILTLLYSAVIAGLLYYILYLVSLRIKMNFSESLFLIALVLVIIGIVVLITKNPRFVNCGGRQRSASIEEDEEIDEPKTTIKSFLIGFNSITIILIGVLLLVVDAIIK